MGVNDPQYTEEELEQKRKILIDEAMEENGKDIQRAKRPGFVYKPGPLFF